MIYFDSAATTLQKPPAVRRATGEAMATMASPGRGDYGPAARAAKTLLACREEAAALFQVAEPERVILTTSATHGLNIAIKTLVKPGSTVLLTGYEHNAVTRPLAAIPGHAMFGVVMGAALGQAKWLERHGQREQAASLRTRAWLTAAVLHGLYDFLLVGFGWIFYVYFVLLVIYVVRLLKRSAREDGPVG